MSNASLKFQFKLITTNEMLEKRGLAEGGITQQFVDSEVLRKCEKYVPFDTGALRNSGILATVIGSGEVVYNTPYARYQYYGVSKNGKELKYRGGGQRGRLWFERMKAIHKKEILEGAAKISGSKGR